MKNKTVVAEGLAAYTIERRFGFDRYRPDGAPPWDEVRTMWAKAVLGEMDELNGNTTALLDLFNQRLKEAEGVFGVETASLQLQLDTIKDLSEYVRTLSRMTGDNRHQIFAVRELLDDIGSHLPWAGSTDIQNKVIDQANRELRRMTAQQPIRFTRLLLGGERGPAGSTFLPGLVTQTDEILATDFFDEMRWRHGDIAKWPAFCTVYSGGGRGYYLYDADEFDVGIMNEAGDNFLKEPGVSWLGGPYETEVICGPDMTMQ
jgi:hypothetical protein